MVFYSAAAAAVVLASVVVLTEGQSSYSSRRGHVPVPPMADRQYPYHDGSRRDYGRDSRGHVPYQPRVDDRDNSGVVGYNATPHQFPFQASIRINGYHACGGAIVSSKAILTTAHCVTSQKKSSITVVVGTTHLERNVRHLDIKKYKVHPRYNKQSKDFDVAIVFLKHRLPLGSNNVDKVDLPHRYEKFHPHAMVTISGWGGETGSGRFAKQLKYVFAPLMDTEICKTNFPAVTDTMICVGELVGARTACPGDAGGPLTTGNLLIGLLSWSYGCGAEGKPTVFTEVASVRDWIGKNL